MENIPVVMVHDNLSHLDGDIPAIPGFHFREFQSGDENLWSALQTTTDSFTMKEEALKHFSQEFDSNIEELMNRCFFLVSDFNRGIGTAMAWLGDGRFSQEYGRLHWVAIHPDFRGQGLGKYLIKYTLHQMARTYSKAYLTSQTISYPAINIYLDFGFKPYIDSRESQRAWILLKNKLRHPALHAID